MHFFHVDNEYWSDCVDAEADLSLRLVHMSEGTFSHVTGQLLMLLPEIARMPGKTGIYAGVFRTNASTEGPDHSTHPQRLIKVFY